MEDTRGVSAGEAASDAGALMVNARQASEFLKALAHEGRLVILCHLVDGERSVGEIEALLGARQAAVSQQLARLRHEGLVKARRDGKTIFYSVGDPKVRLLVETLHALFSAVPRD
ncbi:MAG: helix-turn-helix transcriptional regulator [Rhodobacteraceae bacterium]|nr:helix-turn-helix transcriptional regulator [Paracoccaceae bacterium]